MDSAKLERIKAIIRNVPDFPKPGILFRDLTTAFKDPQAMQDLTAELVEKYRNLGITKVVGIESRGFIMGAVLANAIGAGLVPIRKPGKLPADTIKQSYAKEYGTDTIEMHRDAITPDDVVVIHDDLLATGGTMLAALELVNSCNPKKVYVDFIVELCALEGRKLFPENVEVNALIKY